MKAIARALILFYKRTLSHEVGTRCIYTPTCSMYTLDAVERYGFIRGVLMGCMRILRCNPLSRGGFDPVRENFRGSAKWTL